MGTATQVTSFSDLYSDLINRVRQSTGVTAIDSVAKRYINTALQDVHIGMEYRLPWAERRATLLAQAPYSTGTVTIAQGATTVSGNGTLWNTLTSFSGVRNMTSGGYILIAGSHEPYRVSPTGDTTCELFTAFAEASVTAASYLFYCDEYSLASDFSRPVDAQLFSPECAIEIIPRTEFRRRYPSNSRPGNPTVACILDTQADTRMVKFAAPPNKFMNIPYTYITNCLAVSAGGAVQLNLVLDTDTPIVPLRYRHVIVLHALANWYRDKKDDTRSQEAKAEYVDLMTRITMDQEVGANRPSLAPRTSGYMRSAQNPYSGSGRRYRRY